MVAIFRTILVALFISLSATAFAAPDFATLGTPIIILSDEIHRIAPNPADTYFELFALPDVVIREIHLLDANGNEVYTDAPNSDYAYVPTATLPNGLYSLVIVTLRATHTTNIVIEHP